ncbi:hypothetical protein [Streptomyces malaysiensis]|uniref:Uncharacterized protein n=1 Tax=Streptomyces malaysiensis subsp. samsunensis TaxID=459658 RepID=A0A9X2LY16_STRMQ|nr:hypothetical protein [Streptomyces samsunensis]MCQ8831842.1 hypothetical protein [Streptomyces samsunensis]
MYTPTRDEVADIYYGVGVLDFEDHEAACTHDRRKAIAALNAFHRHYCSERLVDIDIVPERDMKTGWARFEDRSDGQWTVGSDADDPGAFPVTWLRL